MDSLLIYLKHRLKNRDLLDTSVYCRLKEDESIQYWFSFTKTYNSPHIILTVSYYKNYIKESESPMRISDFGKIENIIHSLIIANIKNEKETDIIIGIRLTDEPTPNENVFKFRLNKKDVGYASDECPVCKLSWIAINPILLPCNHSICSECLMGILHNNGSNCPLCRSTFI
jgi:hypothetical protein